MAADPSVNNGRANIGFQGFPQVSTAFVDPDTGRINLVWMQLLRTMWLAQGSAQLAAVESIFEDV